MGREDCAVCKMQTANHVVDGPALKCTYFSDLIVLRYASTDKDIVHYKELCTRCMVLLRMKHNGDVASTSTFVLLSSFMEKA
jgi:hypothetical protein